MKAIASTCDDDKSRTCYDYVGEILAIDEAAEPWTRHFPASTVGRKRRQNRPQRDILKEEQASRQDTSIAQLQFPPKGRAQ